LDNIRKRVKYCEITQYYDEFEFLEKREFFNLLSAEKRVSEKIFVKEARK